MLKKIVLSTWKSCQNRGNSNVCPRGRPGPPGRAGPRGDKGRRGRKGSLGLMGPPGKSGKQGVMGPPGIRGENGMKGDMGQPGKPGVPGLKGEPGESISSPKVAVIPPKLIVNETNTASLLCSTSGNPTAQISWSKINGSLPSNRTKVRLDGLMQITDVRTSDSGKYKCVAQNILGKDEKTARLVVRSKPKVSLSFGPTYVEKGKNVTLPKCHVTSFPPAVITWSRVRGELAHSRTVMENGQLSIIRAQKRDFGLYECKASNILGHDSALTNLGVLDLPRFTINPPAQLDVGKGENISVPCQGTGDPQPIITWVKDNSELPVGRSQVSANGTLQMWNVKDEDSGIYICSATSEGLFKTSSLMQLIVTVAKECGPVGVADKNTIPNAALKASTFADKRYQPYYGRLHESRGNGGWCPSTESDRTDYLQVDMGTVLSVCAVATQGVRYHPDERTTSYKLHLSTNGVTWKTYKESNVEKAFPGNLDRDTLVKNSLISDVKARYVRFYPVTYAAYPCLRVEIFVRK